MFDVKPTGTEPGVLPLLTYTGADPAGNTSTAYRYVIADYDPFVRRFVIVEEPVISVGTPVGHAPAGRTFVGQEASGTPGYNPLG